jgi:hypothetical protein
VARREAQERDLSVKYARDTHERCCTRHSKYSKGAGGETKTSTPKQFTCGLGREHAMVRSPAGWGQDIWDVGLEIDTAAFTKF